VRASSAVPAVFQPVKLGERELVEAGPMSPVPVRCARQVGAEFVIALGISSLPEGQPTSDAVRRRAMQAAVTRLPGDGPTSATRLDAAMHLP